MSSWLRRQQARLVPYSDPLLGAAFTVLGIITLATATPATEPGREPDAFAYALAIAMAAPLAVRRRWPLVVLGVIVAALILYNARAYPDVNVDFFGPVIATYTIAASKPTRVALAAAGTVAIAVGIGFYVDESASESAGDWLLIVVFTLGTWFVGDSVRRRRMYASALEGRTRELEDARLDLARQAVTDERLRMARELHDVVAHTLTAIVVQTAVARHRFEQEPEAAAESLDGIETLTRGALEELRSTLSVLRSEDGDLAQLAPAARLADVDQLAERVAASGVAVTIHREGDLDGLPPLVELAAYRIVQEALTNVVKHAPGARVDVRLAGTRSKLAIEVRDDGLTNERADVIAGAGRGLAGMQERAALLGGTFEAGPASGGGFRVAAILPLAAPRGITP
jgi:signal transduction histidine kinase